jgi:hypothetical protein
MSRNSLLHSALRDFGAANSGATPIRMPEPVIAFDEPFPIAFPEPIALAPVVDVEAAVAEAVAQAEDALRLELEAQHQAVIEEMRVAHRAELERLAAELGHSAAERIDRGLTVLADQVSEALTERVAHLLAPFIGEKQTARAVDALVDALRQALAERGEARVAARGPRLLWEQLQPALKRAGIEAEWEEGAGVDLSVSLGDTLWRTKLDGWFGELSDAVGKETP